jgi:hypothetical protein
MIDSSRLLMRRQSRLELRVEVGSSVEYLDQLATPVNHHRSI